jgi:hypothetical protein
MTKGTLAMTKGGARNDIQSKVTFKRLIQFLLSVTLAQTFYNRSSALTGAAITDLALAEPFIASGAAVGFWYFFPTEKGLGPRGYERDEIMIGW